MFLFYERGISAVFMGLIFLIAIILMKYIKRLGKKWLPYGYVPRPFVLELFRINYRPFEGSDFDDGE